MPKPPNSQVFGGKRAPDDHFAQFSAFGPEKRRIPARRAHRLSPLVTASSPLSLGPKSAQKAWKSEAGSAASMGLQILVDPASSHMLVSKPFLKRSRAPHRSRISGPSFQLRAWCGPGAGLVRAWCGPGAGLAILRWAQDCSLNPALATGLLQPFLRHTQDCPDVPQQPVHVWS